VIRRRGFAEHLGLSEYRGNAVRLAVTVVAVAVVAAAVVVVEPLAAVAVAAVVVLLAAPEAAAAVVVVVVAVAVAAGTGVSSVPYGTAPIRDSDSQELRRPSRQI
jgi:ABC-type transport system involved in cytochrome c biogenesis permease subunit